MHFYRCKDFADQAAYADVDSFFADLTAIFRAEIPDLIEAGCRYIQIDEVAVALLCDPAIRQKVEAAGSNRTGWSILHQGDQQAVAGAPKDVVFGVHMCRGNFKGHYLAAGGYELVAERFFSETRVNHFLLEYDTERAGDFAPLRFVQEQGRGARARQQQGAGAGKPRRARRRTDEATKFIDLDRLAISPQCGFASTVAGNPVTEADQRAKLALVVNAAKAIWL